MVPLLVFLLQAGSPPEISAQTWINNPSLRLQDNRTVVLLFFQCRDRESVQLARRLNRLSGRPEVVVIGLTADPPADVVLRRFAIHALADAQEPAARQYLMQIVADEPDQSLRLAALTKLVENCPVGDFELADHLAVCAAREPELLNLRPLLEYFSVYLRTGIEDPAQFPLPCDE